MSLSLEERRAERRRQRQLKEDVTNGTKFPDELHADVQERLARRRQERLNRISGVASGGITVNGEDDLERKRRERREARLRASEDTTDDYTSRRSRRRGTEEDITNTEDDYSTSLSRRRRNWDDDEQTPTVNSTPSLPDTSEEDAAAERRRRQREEEEEEARRQQEKEAAEEQRRQEEELRRKREEEEQRRREEARREEEERQRRKDESFGLSDREQHCEDEEEEEVSEEETANIQADEKALFIDEDQLLSRDTVRQEDRLDRVKQWNDSNNENYVLNVGDTSDSGAGGKSRSKERSRNKGIIRGESLDIGIDGKRTRDDLDKGKNGRLGRSASFQEREMNNNVKDKLNKFEHLRESDRHKSGKDKAIFLPSEKKEGLKERLQRFEQEKKGQEKAARKKTGGQQSNTKREPAVFSPPSQKVSAKLQQFEIAMKSQSTTQSSTRNPQTELEKIGSTKNQRQALLGRWSQSETQIHNTALEPTPRKNILDRWKPSQDSPKASVIAPVGRKDVVTKALCGNTEFIASKYLEKASKSTEEPVSPRSATANEKSPTFSSRERYSSGSFESSFVKKKTFETQPVSNDSHNQSKSHANMAEKWPPKEPEVPANKRAAIHSRGSSSEDSFQHSRASSLDAFSERSGRHSQADKEEEERLEQERLEQEQQEESRMAEEQKKRKGKKKGLGGLTPEKKKLLKDTEVDYTTDEEREKQRVISERLEPLPSDIDFLSTAELKKLCKKLHETLAQIHSETYDWEFKVGKQEQEVTTLTNKVNDSKGKFVKPVLRKVNKTEQKFAKVAKKAKEDYREVLKSTNEDEEEAE